MTAAGIAAVVAAPIALALGWLASRHPHPDLVRENHAGRPVPVVLGVAMVLAALLGRQVAFVASGEAVAWHGLDIATVLFSFGLLAAGIVDDRRASGPRGLRAHVGSLFRGRPTTGILKLAVGVAAGVTIAVLAGGGVIRVAAAAVLIASTVNLYNALDVAPGRSLKWGAIALGALLPTLGEGGHGVLVASTLAAVLVLLPLDLRERGMLGDAGANPLGLVVGVGLALVFPTPGVVAAASVGLLLQAAAETVTISRLIEAAPPLAWLDRLGRR